MRESRLPRPARKHNGVASWVEIGGQRFYARSRLEARHAEHLETLKRAGVVTSWEHEPRTFHFPNRSQAPVNYKPDFLVKYAGGFSELGIHEPRDEWHECKGHWTRRDVTKLRLMARHYPEIRITVIGAPLSPADAEAIEKARAFTLRERAKTEATIARTIARHEREAAKAAKVPKRRRAG